MAELFLAQGPDGRVCAVKRILPHLAHEEGFIRMFIDEARIVQHLDHPNIAGVMDQGKVDGYYFIALEYVEGHSLLALNDRARQQKIPLPYGLLAHVIGELLGGLGAAHSARDHKGRHLGVVHRDVTPQNVMISYSGDVKLIDFGVAKARARLTKTEAGFTKGKLAYMSPEQARGEELDGRSDLFSVGIVLWEITTGHRLFNKEGPGGILGAIVNDPIPPPSQKKRKYPRDLENIVMRALAKDVKQRWQSAEEMAVALMRFAASERPRPGKARLADLVQDLFGQPEHRDVIDEVQAVSEPTPAGEVEAQIVRGASLRVGKTKIPNIVTDLDDSDFARRPDETRMMDVGSAQASAISRAKIEVTGDEVPVLPPLDHAAELHDPEEIPVPEPRVPFRVRLARRLAAFAEELALGFRTHRRRYLLSILAMSSLVAGIVLVGSGGAARFFGLVEDAADRAREIKRSAGMLSTGTDAQVMITRLSVMSEPPGALVEIDGLGAGCVTPCLLDEAPVGRRFELGLRLGGYRPYAEDVLLRRGDGDRQIEVRLRRQIGALQVTSDPPGATVSKDGKKLSGTTPLTVDGVRADRPVELLVQKSGYIPKRKVVLLRDEESLTEHFELEIDPSSIPPGRLDVSSSPAGCPVEIDGRAVGLTPLQGMALKAGTYSVTVRCEYHRAETRAALIEAGATRRIEVQAEPAVFGYLSLQITPDKGTKVRINGRAIPLPIQFLKVVPGRHQVQIENKGLAREKNFNVEVGPEQRVSREIALDR